MGKLVNDDRLDMIILAQGLEGCLPEFQWMELRRLSPLLILPRNHPLAGQAKIDPAQLRGQPLHGLGQADFPEYAPRLRTILQPFGVRLRLVSQSADGVATLFAILEACGGVAVLTEGVLNMMPAALVSRPFCPALASSVVVLGSPALPPNVQAETFARLLHTEALRVSIPATEAVGIAPGRSSAVDKGAREGE